MVSVYNNSNANSSLINTILASPSVINPSIYSTEVINPPASINYNPINALIQPTNNATTNFTLSKFGIIQQVLLSFTVVGGANFTTQTGEALSWINRIDLLSGGGRVLSSMTRDAIVAQLSDLEDSQLSPIFKTFLIGRSAARLQHNFTIPLVFDGFMTSENLQLNSTFLEPLSIQVYWSGTVIGPAMLVGNITSVANTRLQVRYKNYPENSMSEILASNYSAPQLNQLGGNYYQEVPVELNLGATATRTAEDREFKVDLKNTEVVSDFYVLVRAKTKIVGRPDTLKYLEPKNVTLRISGQDVCDLRQEELDYGRICSNGYSIEPSGSFSTAITQDYPLQHIKKIQLGLWNNSASRSPLMSNALSLRQCNAPQIIVTIDGTFDANDFPNNAVVECFIIEKTLQVYSTSSAIGRITQSLSN